MKPSYWILEWVDPATGLAHTATYYQRARVRGAAIVKRAQGMESVNVKAYWRNPE